MKCGAPTSYRGAAARASQFRLELDHLRHSRDNAVRREHELERALDDERVRAHARESELKRRLRNSKRESKLNEGIALRQAARTNSNKTNSAAKKLQSNHDMEAEKLALERKLLHENRRVLELEEELDRQLTREQRMKRQVEKLRQEEEIRLSHAAAAGYGATTGPGTQGYHNPPFDNVYGNDHTYNHAMSIANLRSALAVQQAEIEDLQRVKRELREQQIIDREMHGLKHMEAREREFLGRGAAPSSTGFAAPYRPNTVATGTPYFSAGAYAPSVMHSAPAYPAQVATAPSVGYGGAALQQQYGAPYASTDQTLVGMLRQNEAMLAELQRLRQNNTGSNNVPAHGNYVGMSSGMALEQIEAQLIAQTEYVRSQMRIQSQQGLYNGNSCPYGPVNNTYRMADWGGVNGNLRITAMQGGTMPARYSTAESGTSTIDPLSQTTNWRVQGGMQSAAMAQEGKSKQVKASRQVAWVEKPSDKEVGQQYQIQRAACEQQRLAAEVNSKTRKLDEMDRALATMMNVEHSAP